MGRNEGLESHTSASVDEICGRPVGEALHTPRTDDLYDLYDLYDLCDLYDLPHVAEWELQKSAYDLGHLFCTDPAQHIVTSG